VETTAEKSK